MNGTHLPTLQEALAAFDFGGFVVGAPRFGAGHINDTFCVYTQQPDDSCLRFILQRINTKVFPRPDQLMENILGVTRHLAGQIAAAGGDVSRETMTVVHTREGQPYFIDSEGRAWRVYTFVEQTLCLQQAETPALFAASGKAFGKFQRQLADYPAATLHETIAKFHDTENRLKNLELAIAEDKLGRVASAQAEVDFALARRQDCSVAMDALRRGILPLRVTHNDTKLNNIMMDKTTLEGICVIDLDTVMPGLSINDFGDSIRFGANHSAEDEQDLTKVNFDLNLYTVYAQAYLEGAGDCMTAAERAYMPWGAKLMTLECGMRFLTDYLEGDTYFRTHREGQNLDRCRTQFKLVADMEAQWAAMEAVTK